MDIEITGEHDVVWCCRDEGEEVAELFQKHREWLEVV